MDILVCLRLFSRAPKPEFKQSGSKEMQRLDITLQRSIRYFEDIPTRDDNKFTTAYKTNDSEAPV